MIQKYLKQERVYISSFFFFLNSFERMVVEGNLIFMKERARSLWKTS